MLGTTCGEQRENAMFGAISDLGEGIARWRTWWCLGLQDIELRYRRSLLGPFWISASLVATVLALAFVFSEIFQQEFVVYVSFLGTGLLVWNTLLALTIEGCNSVTEHSAYLQNVRLSPGVIAGRIVLRNAVMFLHNFVAMLLVLLMFGVDLTLTAFAAFPGMAVIFIFGYFLVLTMGPICARFRDIPQVVASIMQVLFFLTPIIWMPSSVSHRPMFTHANPFYHLLEVVRAPMLGDWPTQLNWNVALGACGVMAVLAITTMSVTRKRVMLWL